MTQLKKQHAIKLYFASAVGLLVTGALLTLSPVAKAEEGQPASSSQENTTQVEPASGAQEDEEEGEPTSGAQENTAEGEQSFSAAGNKPDVVLYRRNNFQGGAFRTNEKVADLGQFNNRASSVRVNNDKTWRFYSEKNFQGRYIDVQPKESLAKLIKLNNDIESLQALP